MTDGWGKDYERLVYSDPRPKEFPGHVSLKFQLVRPGHQRIWHCLMWMWKQDETGDFASKCWIGKMMTRHQILRQTQIFRERTRIPQGKTGGVKPKQYSKPGYRMRMNDNLTLVNQKVGNSTRNHGDMEVKTALVRPPNVCVALSVGCWSPERVFDVYIAGMEKNRI